MIIKVPDVLLDSIQFNNDDETVTLKCLEKNNIQYDDNIFFEGFYLKVLRVNVFNEINTLECKIIINI